MARIRLTEKTKKSIERHVGLNMRERIEMPVHELDEHIARRAGKNIFQLLAMTY